MNKLLEDQFARNLLYNIIGPRPIGSTFLNLR